MMLVGLGLFVGNVVGGKMADRFSPIITCLALLVAMAADLLGIYFVSSNQVLLFMMTFVVGSCSMAVAAPIQILMIRSSNDAEMLGASVTQAAFNKHRQCAGRILGRVSHRGGVQLQVSRTGRNGYGPKWCCLCLRTGEDIRDQAHAHVHVNTLPALSAP